MDPNTPEKVPRTPSERKRKRKADDSSGAPGKGVRNATSDKKINDYFKHSGNSPIRHGGAKSPSPQQTPYPMVRKTHPTLFNRFTFPNDDKTHLYMNYA